MLVNTDNKLSWKKHIFDSFRIISLRKGNFFKAISVTLLKTLYYDFSPSRFQYRITGWEGTCKTEIQSTRKTQNKFIKPLRIVIYSVQNFKQFFNSALANFYHTEAILHKKCEQRHST